MKKLLALLIPAIIGWMLIGKMPLDNWEKLTVPEKKATVSFVIDNFFNKTNCEGADFRILIDKEVQFYAICTKPRKEC